MTNFITTPISGAIKECSGHKCIEQYNKEVEASDENKKV